MWDTSLFYVGYLCNNVELMLACLPSGSTDVTASPSQYMTQLSGIPILSPVLFMHVGDSYIPLFKIGRILIYLSHLLFNRQVYSNLSIRESVDSLCRDGADMPRPPYIGKACTRPNLEDLSLFRYLSNVYESLCTQ